MTPTDKLYVLSDRDGLVKVGVSGWGISRVRVCYAPSNSARVAVAETLPVHQAYKVERAVHRALSAHRYDGPHRVTGSSEWFSVSISTALKQLGDAYQKITGEQCLFKVACPACGGFGTDANPGPTKPVPGGLPWTACRTCRGSRYFADGTAFQLDYVNAALRDFLDRRMGKRNG